MSARLLKIIIILGAVVILGSVFVVYFKQYPEREIPKQKNILKPARHEHGRTVSVKSFDVDINGGIFEIGNAGTPIDGAVIEIPKGAIDKKTTVSVGYNDGAPNLRGGKSSGVVMVLSTKSIINFKQPIKIKVRFNPSLNPKTIVGYSIDEQGNLHAIDMGKINKKIGEVSFYSFHTPFAFTWVYID